MREGRKTSRGSRKPESSWLGKNVHLVGIGGSGMSGLARILHELGARISGTDRAETDRTRLLRKQGMSVWLGHRPEHVPPDADRLVHSAAVAANSPELREAERRGIPVQTYAEVLGELVQAHDGVVVAGTHGKTTTTAMVAHCLVRSGRDPSFLVGGAIPDLGGNAASGRGKLFVAEACEYNRSFLHLRPRAAIITNVEAEHLDFYRGGIREIIEAFREFVRQIRPGGVLVVPDYLRTALTSHLLPFRVMTFGQSPGADWRMGAIHQRRGLYSFQAEHPASGARIPLSLAIPGGHNAMNALAAAALLHDLGVSQAAISEGLSTFQGVDRRFESVEATREVLLVDDYAHHPTEVRAALKTARECFCGQRIWVVFEPHLPSRVSAFRDEFATELAQADQVIVCRTYGGRESDVGDTLIRESVALSRRILEQGGESVFLPSHEAIVDYLTKRVVPPDVVLALGAGDVTRVTRLLAQAMG